MTNIKLRSLLYTSGVIAGLGVLFASFALDRVNTATARADRALQVATMVASQPATGELPAAGHRALVDFERASDQSSRATLALAVWATLTPLLIFLNLLGFARAYRGQFADEETVEAPSLFERLQLRLLGQHR